MRLQSEVALEAVDEKKPPLVLEDQKRVVAVERSLDAVVAEELEGDLGDGYLSERAHGFFVVSGSESTWKVG